MTWRIAKGARDTGLTKFKGLQALQAMHAMGPRFVTPTARDSGFGSTGKCNLLSRSVLPSIYYFFNPVAWPA